MRREVLKKSNIFEYFTQLFEYFRTFYTSFQTFSIVFERFRLAYFPQTLQINSPNPVFNSKTNTPHKNNPQKTPFFLNLHNSSFFSQSKLHFFEREPLTNPVTICACITAYLIR